MSGLSRRRRFGRILISLASALALSTAAAAAQASPGALGSQQLAQLRSQPLPIVVPSYVPSGFRLVHVEATNKKTSSHANRYTLRYRSADGRQFTIDVGDGEFGDADPDYTSFRRPFVANSSLIGSTKMSPYKMGSPDQSYWIYASDYRSLEHLGNAQAMLMFSGKNMSPDELRRIYSSLQSISR